MQAPGLLTPRPQRAASSGGGPLTPTAGPSSPGPGPAGLAAPDSVSTGAGSGAGSGSARDGEPADLWEDILRSADRQKTHAHKNIILLAERHRGRTHLLDKLAGKRRQRAAEPGAAPALAIGYQVLESEDRDEGELDA